MAFIGVVAALFVAAGLHTIDQRWMAAFVVFITVPWGLVVTGTLRHSVSLPLLVSIAVVVRLAQVGSPPWLSDDVYRYLFEGLALNRGYNPFLNAPATLTHLAPSLAERVNHAEIPSIYPPTAHVWFRLLGSFPHVWFAQVMTALVDVGVCVQLSRMLARRGHPGWPALVYALHPVAVLESAHGAHLEPLGVLLGLFVVEASDRKAGPATVLAWLGIGVKLLPALFLPYLLRQTGWRRALFWNVAGAMLLVVMAAPVLMAGPALLDAMGTYARSWSFNGLIHPVAALLFGESGSRCILMALGGCVALYAARLDDSAQAWKVVGLGFLMLSPTVHPWYTLWALVPCLLTADRAWAAGIVWLQASYLVLFWAGPESWWVPPWLAPLTWGGTLGTVAYFRRLPNPTRP